MKRRRLSFVDINEIVRYGEDTTTSGQIMTIFIKDFCFGSCKRGDECTTKIDIPSDLSFAQD